MFGLMCNTDCASPTIRPKLSTDTERRMCVHSVVSVSIAFLCTDPDVCHRLQIPSNEFKAGNADAPLYVWMQMSFYVYVLSL